jgi:hypothetical protein
MRRRLRGPASVYPPGREMSTRSAYACTLMHRRICANGSTASIVDDPCVTLVKTFVPACVSSASTVPQVVREMAVATDAAWQLSRCFEWLRHASFGHHRPTTNLSIGASMLGSASRSARKASEFRIRSSRWRT